MNLDRPDSDFDSWSGSGRAVMSNYLKLCATAKKLSLRTLDDYLSTLFTSDENSEDYPEPVEDERWFEPGEGRIWIEKLSTYVKDNPIEFDHPRDLLEDFEFYDYVLKHAQSRGARWNLWMDT